MKKQVLRTLFFSIAFLTGFLAKAQNDCPTWEWAFDAGVPSQVQLLESHGDTAGNMYFVGTFQTKGKGGDYDITGMRRMTQMMEANQQLDLRHLPQGVYILNQNGASIKLMKE